MQKKLYRMIPWLNPPMTGGYVNSVMNSGVHYTSRHPLPHCFSRSLSQGNLFQSSNIGLKNSPAALKLMDSRIMRICWLSRTIAIMRANNFHPADSVVPYTTFSKSIVTKSVTDFEKVDTLSTNWNETESYCECDVSIFFYVSGLSGKDYNCKLMFYSISNFLLTCYTYYTSVNFYRSDLKCAKSLKLVLFAVWQIIDTYSG